MCLADVRIGRNKAPGASIGRVNPGTAGTKLADGNGSRAAVIVTLLNPPSELVDTVMKVHSDRVDGPVLGALSYHERTLYLPVETHGQLILGRIWCVSTDDADGEVSFSELVWLQTPEDK